MLWINDQSTHTERVVRDFVRDLRTGEVLIGVVESMAGKSVPGVKFAQNELSYRENVEAMLRFVEAECGISNEDKGWAAAGMSVRHSHAH